MVMVGGERVEEIVAVVAEEEGDGSELHGAERKCNLFIHLTQAIGNEWSQE